MQKPQGKSILFTVYLTPPILDRNKLSHWVKVNSVEVIVFVRICILWYAKSRFIADLNITIQPQSSVSTVGCLQMWQECNP